MKFSRFSCIILITFLFTCLLFGTASAEYSWEKILGGTGYDYGNSVQQTSDEGYIIVGTTMPFGVDDRDVYLIKTDSEGNEQWSNTFGDTLTDFGYSVQQTSDGGYIIVGQRGSSSNGTYLVKTDANGMEIWTKALAGYGGNSVQQTTDGGYVISGNLGKVWFIKTDKNGNEIWRTTYDGGYQGIGRSVRQTADGGYITTGSIPVGPPVNPYGNPHDVYLVKTHPNGNVIWSKTFDIKEQDIGESVQETSDGCYIIVGRTKTFSTSDETFDICLIRTDANGNEIWSKTFGSSGADTAYSVQQTKDGGFILTGSTTASNNWMDVLLLKTNADGEETWRKTFGGNYHDGGSSLQQTSDGGYIVVGSTQSGSGGSNVYLIYYNPLIIDNGDPDTNSTGTWNVSAGLVPYGVDSLTSRDPAATYTYEAPLDGSYQAALWWTRTDTRCTDVKVEVSDSTGVLDTIYIDQKKNDGRWNVLGTYNFSGTGKVKIYAKGSSCSTCADAVRFDYVPPADEVTIDNGDKGSTPTGTWEISGGENPYGNDSLTSRDPTATYTYEADLDGSYEAALWWTTTNSRCSNVRVEISDANGILDNVYVNQRQNDGRWNVLGRHYFSGLARVKIYAVGSGCSTCADAVRFFPKGSVIRVPQDQPTIQAGIDAASHGDTVLVADGDYSGPGNYSIDFKGKAINVRSENGPGNCTISLDPSDEASWNMPIFHFHNGEGRDSVVSGFFIPGSWSDPYGIAILIESSSPSILNCRIANTPEGIGIKNESSSSPFISNCIFQGFSYKIYNVYSFPIIKSCSFVGDCGGVINHSSVSTFVNCIFYGVGTPSAGRCDDKAMGNSSSTVTITNCTFYANGTAISNVSSAVTITNSILWENEGVELSLRGNSTATASYSDVYGDPNIYVEPGSTLNYHDNINDDPMFINASGYYDPDWDLHLQVDSPCIDAGDSSAPYLPLTDLDGNPRIVGSAPDIGAYEYPCEVLTYYRDADEDGYGNPNESVRDCSAPSGYVEDNTDCDDSDPLEHPNQTWYKDQDDDGYSDGVTNTISCTRPDNFKVESELTATSGDCDDNDPNKHPGAPEVCNGEDDDCDGEVDEGVKTTYYRDVDGDGYGNPGNSTQACSQPPGYVPNDLDCNDNDPAIHPGAREICNGKDDDCDGSIDEGVQTTFFRDADSDGYGDPNNWTKACSLPSGYVINDLDCDDTDPNEHPDEVWFKDVDSDGYSDGSTNTVSCTRPVGFKVVSELIATSGDCDDTDPAIHPGAVESCNSKDDDCDGDIDEGVLTTYYEDYDGDGYGDPGNSTQACTQPSGYVLDATDCDDTDDSIHPGAKEICNTLDDDCDGQTDEQCIEPAGFSDAAASAVLSNMYFDSQISYALSALGDSQYYSLAALYAQTSYNYALDAYDEATAALALSENPSFWGVYAVIYAEADIDVRSQSLSYINLAEQYATQGNLDYAEYYLGYGMALSATADLYNGATIWCCSMACAGETSAEQSSSTNQLEPMASSATFSNAASDAMLANMYFDTALAHGMNAFNDPQYYGLMKLYGQSSYYYAQDAYQQASGALSSSSSFWGTYAVQYAEADVTVRANVLPYMDMAVQYAEIGNYEMAEYYAGYALSLGATADLYNGAVIWCCGMESEGGAK